MASVTKASFSCTGFLSWLLRVFLAAPGDVDTSTVSNEESALLLWIGRAN